jgi:hypothetical protein
MKKPGKANFISFLTLDIPDNQFPSANTVSCGNLTCHNICKATVTGHKTLKHSNHLSTYYLYRDRDKALAHRDGKYCAIPACHRDSFTARNRDKNPAGCASNANYHNCRAVSGH